MSDGSDMRAMLQEAMAVLWKSGEPIEDVLEAYYLGERRRTVAVAFALGVLEGAGVTLGLTALELLDEYGLRAPPVSPAPAARTRRRAPPASRGRAPR